MRFAVSGVEVNPAIPAAVSFVISTITSTAGVSGAFLLLPLQVSLLRFTGPAVTPTNHLFNVVAIPSGVYRYMRERRMVWPLTWIIIAGTLPGVIIGSLARIYVLQDARRFKLFAGLVLLLIGSRLLRKVVRPPERGAPAADGQLEVKTVRFDLRRLEYDYRGERHGVGTWALGTLTAVVGIVGGAYGVGGGSIIVPFLVSFFGLPVHTIAGAALAGTCLTSIAGVGLFAALAPLLHRPDIAPDWLLGLLFGAGGLGGMYCGARLQRFLPARLIEGVLALTVAYLAVRYIGGYFWR